MNADEFGNYIAGYGAGYALGPQGVAPLWAGGSLYGTTESASSGQWELSQVPLLGGNWGSARSWFPGLVDGVRDGGWYQGLIMMSPVVHVGAIVVAPPTESDPPMSSAILLLLVLGSGIGGYATGRFLGPLALLAELVFASALVFLMARSWSRYQWRVVVRGIAVGVIVVVGATAAMARMGVRHFREDAIASIDSCALLVPAVQSVLASQNEYTTKVGLPDPWGELEAKRFDDGEMWVRFHEKWRTIRRGLVYYPGSTWIRDGKMGAMRAEKVREGWYLFY